MPRTFDYDLVLDEIIELGFPARPEFVEFVKKEENRNFLNITVEVMIDSHGYPSNNWDDPGAGAEWHIHEIHISTQLHWFFPVTDEMNSWLENHLDERFQLAYADDSWDDYDD